MMKKIAVTILSVGLLGGAVANSPAWAAEPSEALKLAQQLNQAFIEVAESVSKSVVIVRVAPKPQTGGAFGNPYQNSPFFDQLPEEYRRFFERQQEESEKKTESSRRPRKPVFSGQGSGLVYRQDGIILTNSHVVENADKVKIVLNGGKEYDGEVIGVDRQSDIAVVKIDATGLTAAKMGDSGKTKVGEFAIAVGSPYELDYSVTVGHVSAKGRRVFTDRFMFDQDFIQTDASINPGNSGGPLVNIYGEVIGINTLIRGLNTGIGFAVPVNLAKRVADMLIEDGKVTRAWLGVSITTLREDADYRDLAVGVEDGVVVRQFVPGGPAENSDLELADVITAVDGNNVNSAEELKRELRLKKAGDSVMLGLMRNGEAREIEVKTGAFPEEFTAVSRLRRSEGKPEVEVKAKLLGMTVQDITPDLAKRFESESEEGVIVTAVENESIAAEKNISPGDIVTRINSAPVDSVKSFKAALEDEDLKKGVIVHLNSKGSQRFEVLKQYE
ncbi:MAG: trypsin-like peptidase domain-containing protein [Verrucomicrobiota bacterium]|jgi:serine protease Do|nr:trypsin-like peptidase domain-containing protein [Verrucomicrobiota bacterium]MDP7291602.1 trypsin-like peptidase domain-containing protein [Verrucomicrobiota bacterium]MDP7441782.1 trypsin-like peptidase domain-containing protein [Verrucomicrobiota bacterium]HJN81463.1 trypsin-like peptidase domain-containing protein [Verrucomicrobiota bacterium]|tara:strand:- start:1290 stop:2792 length:1503 start_codon:yes stop_codon:yes gene_type:complete